MAWGLKGDTGCGSEGGKKKGNQTEIRGEKFFECKTLMKCF